MVSLTLELDELASKQGEEEAHFVQEIEDLRSQLSKIPREHIQNGLYLLSTQCCLTMQLVSAY